MCEILKIGRITSSCRKIPLILTWINRNYNKIIYEDAEGFQTNILSLFTFATFVYPVDSTDCTRAALWDIMCPWIDGKFAAILQTNSFLGDESGRFKVQGYLPSVDLACRPANKLPQEKHAGTFRGVTNEDWAKMILKSKRPVSDWMKLFPW